MSPNARAIAPQVATRPRPTWSMHSWRALPKSMSTIAYRLVSTILFHFEDSRWQYPRKPFLRNRPIGGPPMSLVLRGGLIVTQDEKRRSVTGDIRVEDGRIAAVGDVDRTADEVIDCSGCAVLPGFINLHHHVANTLLRGLADDIPLEEMLPRASTVDAKLTRRDVRLHTHLSETRGEVEAHRKKTGLRPVEWLEKIGFLGDRVTAAHCVWVTMNEVRALARCGASVAHCPVSNMKLASGGVAPVPEMISEGVVVGLGTDSPISNNGMDVFADMKVAALLHKATRWDARVMSAQTVLDLATIHAARALHVDRELGSIEVGKRADLAVVSLKGAHTTPFYPETVIRHLVYNGRGSDVEATIVDGQVLMSGGVVRTVDEADVIARAQETARELFEA